MLKHTRDDTEEYSNMEQQRQDLRAAAPRRERVPLQVAVTTMRAMPDTTPGK